VGLSRLRIKLAAVGCAPGIETVRGQGYRLLLRHAPLELETWARAIAKSDRFVK